MNLSLVNMATNGLSCCNKLLLPHLFRTDLIQRFSETPCSLARLYNGWTSGWQTYRRSIHCLCRACQLSSVGENISNRHFSRAPINWSWLDGSNSSLESPSHPSGRLPFLLCRRVLRVHRAHRVRLCRRERWRNNLDRLHTCD